MRLSYIAALSLCFLALPSSGSQQQKPADSEQNGTAEPKSNPPVSISENHYHAANQTDPTAEQSKRWPPPWWSPFWSNWAFVVVGLGAAGAAVWTLVAIQDQAGHLSNQVALMDQQLAAFRESERAWVIEEIQFNGALRPPTERDQGTTFFIVFWIKNVGKQPARILNIQTRFHPSAELPEKPEYYVASLAPPPDIGKHGRIVVPGEKIWIGCNLTEGEDAGGGALSADQIYKINHRHGLGLYAYGRVTYESVGVKAVNQFCYSWYSTLSGFSWGFEKSEFLKRGPDEYNKHT